MTRRTLLTTLAAAPLLAQADRRSIILDRARKLGDFPGQRIGGTTPAILEQARKIATGIVFFYQRTEVKVGLHDIDWTGGHIHHQEWPAQLNRFFHLRPLAAAYRSTKDEQFAKAARDYIEDWLRADPYATATKLRPGDNTLNMSIRLGSSHHQGWGATLPVFLASPAFDDAFVTRILDSMSNQAEFLTKHLTATGNWRISQCDALVFTALRFPFLRNADHVRDLGITELRTAIDTQFLPDGVHIERTPSYADWMTDVAGNYVKVARLFPEADAHVDKARLVRSLDYAAQADLFGVNDGDAPERDPTELSGLARRTQTIARLKLDAPPLPPLDQVFPNAGQVFSRTAWKPGADYLAFDASTWGGGHSHLSRLSFVFRSKGRSLIADPGVLTYEMSDARGPYGKSTPAHSTLNLAGRNQSGADAELLHTKFTSESGFIHARYQGAYWEGTYGWNFTQGRGAGLWGDHERMLFWRKGEYILVIDAMTADRGVEIRNCLQLAPMQGAADPQTLSWTSDDIVIQMVAIPAGATLQTPERGLIGEGDKIVAAPILEFRYPSQSNTAPTISAVLVSAKKLPARALKGGLEINGTDHITWSVGLAPAFTWTRADQSFAL